MFKIQAPLKAKVMKTIRFPEELKDQLYTFATKNEVSFNTLVVQCCQYALQEAKAQSETD